MQLPFASMEVLGETSHFLSEILGHRAWVNLDWDSPRDSSMAVRSQEMLDWCQVQTHILSAGREASVAHHLHPDRGCDFPVCRAFHMILCVVQDGGACFSFPGCCEFHCIDLQGTANSSCRVWSLLTVEDSYSQLSNLHLYQLCGAFVALLKPSFNLRFR